jgi:hypothetical protein
MSDTQLSHNIPLTIWELRGVTVTVHLTVQWKQSASPGVQEQVVTSHLGASRYRGLAGRLPDGQITKFLSSPSRKNIPLRALPKSPVYQSPSRPTRGALRGRHERGTGCGGRGCAIDERH